MCFACVRELVGTVVSVTVLEFSVLNDNPYTRAKSAVLVLVSNSHVTSQTCVPFEASVG
jgi:hypothetical protein